MKRQLVTAPAGHRSQARQVAENSVEHSVGCYLPDHSAGWFSRILAL